LAAGQTVATVTNPVALPTIPTGWITATGIAAAALNGKGDWLTTTNLPTNFSSMLIDNNGKLTLTQNFPTNFANTIISLAGLVSSNAAQINGVPTNSVTVIGANIGTTQPVNFTGAGSSALVNSSASTVTSNVTIGGYAAGQDPGSYVLRSPAGKLNTDVNGNVQLAPAGLDLIETEVGITPSTAVVDDNGTQLSAINARQALALCQSLLAGILTGANLNAPLFRAVGNTAKVRLSGVSDISGNRTSATVTLPP
jgi:hypothetical protein